MNIEQIPISALVPYAFNSRTHSPGQIEQIARSIREFGFTNPVLIDGSGGIIAGHGRVMAAQSIGMAIVPCLRLPNLSEAQKRAYIIADNRLALNAGWDEEMLRHELAALQGESFDLELLGFSDEEMADLLFEPPAPRSVDPDATPPVPERAITKSGDIWNMGHHRLLCGDSTDPGAMGLLMRGQMADACWTDPPYNVAYETAAGKIDNDNMADEDFRQFLAGFYRAAHASMKKGAAIYVAHADSERANFTTEFKAAGFKLSGVVIWRKDSLVLGRSDYQWIHEPILYGWKEGGSHKFYGGRKQTTVAELGSSSSPFVQRPDGKWQITIGEEVLIVDGGANVEFVEDSIIKEVRPKRSDLHPTMKPVALIERMLKNSAKPGAIVLDPFGGSGSTLIACQNLGMHARLMELSPNYADVIVRRWQEYTGLAATLDGDGRNFAAIAADRVGK